MNTIQLTKSDLTIPDIHSLLDSVLGNVLEKDELTLLLKHGQLCSFDSEELMLHQGDTVDGIYLLLKGTVLAHAMIMGQGSTLLETLLPGHFLNTISFMENGPCLTSSLATNAVLCLFLPRGYFHMLDYDYPVTKYKLFRTMAKQICAHLKITHDLVSTDIAESTMTSLSFFERFAYSLNQPKKVSFQEKDINPPFLHNRSALKFFTPAERAALFAHLEMLDAPKNCKLINENEKNVACYFIIYGAIQSCIIQEGKLAKLSVIGPGTLLASIRCIDPNSAFNITYITCEQTILFKLPLTALQLIQEHHPELWYKLFERICLSLTALKKSIDKLNIRLHSEIYNR